MAKNRRRAMRELYDRVPSIACQGLCHDSCGPIEMSTLERRTLAERGVQITDRHTALQLLMDDGDFDCDALDEDRRCGVYEDRPLICRLWGVTQTLPCPYGCEPESVLSDAEGMALIAESMHLGGHPPGSPELLSPAETLRLMQEHEQAMQPYFNAIKPVDRRPKAPDAP